MSASTIPAGFAFRIVWSTLVKASNALAPRSFLEQCETLRAITAGLRSRSARFVGRLESFFAEKSQHVSLVVLRANPVQQSLIVFVVENLVPKVERQLIVE